VLHSSPLLILALHSVSSVVLVSDTASSTDPDGMIQLASCSEGVEVDSAGVWLLNVVGSGWEGLVTRQIWHK
jgi:hypothetical protein